MRLTAAKDAPYALHANAQVQALNRNSPPNGELSTLPEHCIPDRGVQMAAPYLLTSSTVVQAPLEVAFDGLMNAPSRNCSPIGRASSRRSRRSLARSDRGKPSARPVA